MRCQQGRKSRRFFTDGDLRRHLESDQALLMKKVKDVMD